MGFTLKRDMLDPVIMVNYHDHDDLSYIISPNHESHYRSYVKTVEVTRLLFNRGIPERKPVTMTHKDPDRVRKRTQSVDCPCGEQVNILIILRSRANFLIVFYDDASKTTIILHQIHWHSCRITFTHSSLHSNCIDRGEHLRQNLTPSGTRGWMNLYFLMSYVFSRGLWNQNRILPYSQDKIYFACLQTMHAQKFVISGKLYNICYSNNFVVNQYSQAYFH